ncbi:hypothetical protein EZV62_019542 [Acer yangbiense]|uniref:GPI-anchored wall transfer protein n=1 Tax=Acer yangbiense TaxID=1000413 RepID=A0A5C7HDJ5_9ROSI|nr:hypothetical protein EZV62_019542 [Acer yangbiense]
MASLPNSFNANKQLKEEFVSNLTGSSFIQIFFLLAVVPISMALRHSIHSCRPIDYCVTETSLKKDDNLSVASKSLWACIATIAVDFIIIFLPMILFFTVLAKWAIPGSILLFFLFFSIAAKRFFSSSNSEEGHRSLRTIISSYRVATMIMTCLCILAVDFRIFPRENAKTETYGTSVMDLGVGSFVVANAIVSRQARNVLSMNWKSALKSISPLIILGFGRLVTTAGVDYQVHVGEYGVHWNFFFTLAGVSILTSITNVPPKYCGILGSLILIGYQCWLNHGLNVYLLSNERGPDIISQNKEGFFSLFGYWGMYLLGVYLGYYLFFTNRSDAMMRSNTTTFVKVWLISLLLWLLTVLLDRYVERVSRRMCNLAYVTWVLALNLQDIVDSKCKYALMVHGDSSIADMLLGGLMISDYVPGSKISSLEVAFDRNLLASFILANMLTGMVNLSINTLFVSSTPALLILIVYALTLSMIVGTADFYGLRLKFW